MSDVTRLFGYTEGLRDTDGALNVLGQSNAYDGLVEVTIRASGPGVFMGGTNVADNLPNTGFELLPDVDYRVVTFLTELRLATESETDIPVTVFVHPKLH